MKVPEFVQRDRVIDCRNYSRYPHNQFLTLSSFQLRVCTAGNNDLRGLTAFFGGWPTSLFIFSHCSHISSIRVPELLHPIPFRGTWAFGYITCPIHDEPHWHPLVTHSPIPQFSTMS